MTAIDEAYKKLIPDLEELEAYRLRKKSAIRNNRIFLLFFLVLSISLIIIVLASGLIDETNRGFVIGLMSVFVMVELAVALIVYVVNISRYRNYFKENIIETLVPALLPGISYQHDRHISFESFNDSGIFNKSKGNKIIGSDYFHGSTGNIQFELSWTNVQFLVVKHHGKYVKGQTFTRKSGTDVFNGIFMIAELSEGVKSTITILPSFKEVGKVLSSVATGIGAVATSDAPEVIIGSQEFQERFRVFSEDSNEAKRVVDEHIMNEMVTFKKMHNEYQLHVSFVLNKVYVAVETVKGLFEPRIQNSLLNADTAKTMFANLLTFLNLLRVFISKNWVKTNSEF